MALLLNANDSVSRSYSITKPSPLHPIIPIGCGEKTKNLLAANSTSATVNTVTISNDNGKITVTGRASSEISSTNLAWKNAFSFRLKAGSYYFAGSASGNVSSYLRNANDDARISMPNSSFVLSNDTDVYIGFWVYNNKDMTFNIMLNLGSTPLPYEPYGYKLPILSNSTVTNIYLGEVETTRRIKKLVLTGEENYDYQPQYSQYVFLVSSALAGGLRNTPCFCTHYQSIYNGESIDNIPNNTIYINWQTAGAQFCIKDEAITTLADFKSYLAQQYTAGTPVTIWYILAEPETGIVNEPLMKIGNYADTVNMEQTGVNIPTYKGTTVINYDGALKPSQMYIKYLGVKK